MSYQNFKKSKTPPLNTPIAFEDIIKRRLLQCQLCPSAVTPETSGFLFLNHNPRFLAGFCKSCWRNTPEKELEKTIEKVFFEALRYAPDKSFNAIRGAEVVF